MRNTFAEINLTAIKNNVRIAKNNLLPTTKLCAVVKANAYGHGAVPVARAAEQAGADYFAVAFCQEGLELRQAGITKPILILGTPDRSDVGDVVRHDFDQAVYTCEQLQWLNEEAIHQNKKVRVHIKIDTGMSRIGIQPEEAAAFAKEAAALPGIEIIGVFSHFATADGQDKSFAELQFSRFEEALEEIAAVGIKVPLRHICNSAGAQELAKYQLDMVRQGITLYGLTPGQYRDEYAGLQPAMVLRTRVEFVKDIHKGDTVGYGRTFRATKATRIATVSIGYADGVSRKLSNRGWMLVRGERAPIVGRVCMDQCMLDVSKIPDVQVGDEVIVAGTPDLPMEQIAQWAETIHYELICAVSARVPRVYKE